MTQLQREKLLNALIEIGQELSSTTDLEELLNRILRVCREVFRFQNAIIRLLDETGRVLTTAASYGYAADAIRQEIHIGEGVMGKVAQSAQPLLVSDVSQATYYIPGIYGACSELAVPMIVKGKVTGVFSVESHRPNTFSEADIPPLMTMASQAAIAIENARLYENLREVSASFKELSQFNSRILKSVNLGIYTLNDRRQITSWNHKMVEMSGVEEEAAIGKSLFELFPGLEEEGFGERVRRVLQVGEADKLRLEHRDFKGNIRFQKRRIAPLKEDGNTVGAVVIVEDITEFKHLVDQTIQREKLAEIGRLTAGIAHEVNNPLAVISYAAQLLEREERITDFQRELVDRIESEVERLKTLTGGLLSFSSPRDTKMRQVDLNEEVKDTLRLLGHELKKKMIRLEESYADIPFVQADPNKLKQIFLNLITNAIQAMEGVGTLTLQTSVVNGDEVELLVQDTGPGIDQEKLDHIFEPFFTTKKEGEGTGLGLYICKNIIMEHKGRIRVKSEPGKGAAFHVVLPVA